jgi:hypothetical protein
MLYLTNERAAMLDGYLRDIAGTADAIQQGTTGSAAPILDYARAARAMLAAEVARGDKLSTYGADSPGMLALRELVEWAGDAPVADVRARAEVAGSMLSRGKAQWIPICAAFIKLVYPADVAPPDVVDPVVATD